MSDSQPAAPVATAAPVGEDVALAIRGLVKIYGNLIAVADLSLDIPTGSFYGIVGPNGAGKTTTLTMATGLLTPDRGTAYVHGVDVWARTQEARALLGVMPDGMRLLDRLSGPDFLVHVGMLHGLDASVARERAHELLAALDLAEAGKKLISDFSAGMTKKIALAAASFIPRESLSSMSLSRPSTLSPRPISARSSPTTQSVAAPSSCPRT